MKLFLNLLGIGFLIFTLAACGGNEGTEESTEATEESTESEITEETETTEEPQELSEETKKFINKWKMVSMIHKDKSEEETKEDEYLILKEDGSFEELFVEKVIASGSWTYNEEEKLLTLTHETGEFKSNKKPEVMEVKEITEEQLITVDDDGKMTETFEVVKE